MSSSDPLAWDDSYSVGDGQLDAQHRELFSLANSLIGLKEDPGPAYLKLREHVRAHFGHEERLMDRIGYPELLSHENEHDRLGGLLNSVRIDIAGGTWRVEAMCTFFRNWLIDHIDKHDRPLANYLRSAAPSDLGSAT